MQLTKFVVKGQNHPSKSYVSENKPNLTEILLVVYPAKFAILEIGSN